MIKKLGVLKILTAVSVLFLISSCSAYKKLPYIQDADQFTREQLQAAAYTYEAKIMPKDILTIVVNSTTPGATRDFNLPLIPSGLNSTVQSTVNLSSSESGSMQNYIVDKDGYVNMAILGKVKIGGLAKSEAEEHIKSLIYPTYLKEEPIVNIRFLSFKVSVLGEVAKPGTFEMINEQATIFDALAAAGDLTIYGKRNNVTLLRTDEKGALQVHKIDLQDRNLLLNKDIYYLQQNDKLYVEANKARGNGSSWGTIESITVSASLSAISIIISVISLATR